MCFLFNSASNSTRRQKVSQLRRDSINAQQIDKLRLQKQCYSVERRDMMGVVMYAKRCNGKEPFDSCVKDREGIRISRREKLNHGSDKGDFFLRSDRGRENRCLEPPRFKCLLFPLSGSCTCDDEFWMRLLRRSERFVCILCIATPFSSVAKSKPRCTMRTPVAMSVRLPRRGSLTESFEVLRAPSARAVCWFFALGGAPRSSSRVRLLGSNFRTQRIRSTSVGSYVNWYALAM